MDDKGPKAADKKPAAAGGGLQKTENQTEAKRARSARGSLLPRALFVAIRLQALPALVLVHLQTTFLFQIAHGER